MPSKQVCLIKQSEAEALAAGQKLDCSKHLHASPKRAIEIISDLGRQTSDVVETDNKRYLVLSHLPPK